MPLLDPAVLNKMLVGRIQDVARQRAGDVDPHLDAKIRRCAGLSPMPPRTSLDVQELGVIEGDGFTITKLSYNSRPTVYCPSLLFTPNEPASAAVVFASDAWNEGKGHICSQALGISLALQGFLVLVLEPPGQWFEGIGTERNQQGGAWDPQLRRGFPALGVYAWDVIRGLDLLEAHQPGVKLSVMGAGIGAEAAMLAHLLDSRSAAFVSANALGSHGLTARMPESLTQLAGIAELGDVADWFAARPAAPVLLMACDLDTLHTPSSVQATATKMQAGFQRRGSGAPVRFARFLGDRDLNRRMREVTAAFLLEHLSGKPNADYASELRPLTDGIMRPAPSGTYPAETLRLLPPGDVDALTPPPLAVAHTPDTLADLATAAIAERYPEVEPTLLPWGKYGKLEGLPESGSLKLTDQTPDAQSLACPRKELDYDALCAIGLSGPEFVAQVLHLLLPGSPEGFESTAMGNDGLRAVVRSVRQMVTKEEPPAPPKSVDAQGDFSAAVAECLVRLRPALTVGEISGATNPSDPELLVPGERYRKF